MDPRRELMRKQYAMSARTSAALVAILPLLTFVSWISIAEPPAEGYASISESTPTLFAFGLAAIAAATASFRVMPWMLKIVATNAEKGVVSPPLEEYAVGGRVDPLDAYAGSMMTANLMSSAISEIPLLLGFVLVIVTGEWLLFAGGATLTAILWAVHFPRFSRWERLLADEEARRSGVPQIVS